MVAPRGPRRLRRGVAALGAPGGAGRLGAVRDRGELGAGRGRRPGPARSVRDRGRRRPARCRRDRGARRPRPRLGADRRDRSGALPGAAGQQAAIPAGSRRCRAAASGRCAPARRAGGAGYRDRAEPVADVDVGDGLEVRGVLRRPNDFVPASCPRRRRIRARRGTDPPDRRHPRGPHRRARSDPRPSRSPSATASTPARRRSPAASSFRILFFYDCRKGSKRTFHIFN